MLATHAEAGNEDTERVRVDSVGGRDDGRHLGGEGESRGLPSGRRQRSGPVSVQSEEGDRDESPAIGEAIYLRDRPPAVQPHE